MRRLKQGSCSSSLGDDSLFAGQPLVKGSSKQQSSEKMKKEKADQDWLKLCEFVEEMKFETSEVEASSDFEGTFQTNSNSNFRKRIRRTKEIKWNKADLKTDGIIPFGQEIDDNDYFDGEI